MCYEARKQQTLQILTDPLVVTGELVEKLGTMTKQLAKPAGKKNEKQRKLAHYVSVEEVHPPNRKKKVQDHGVQFQVSYKERDAQYGSMIPMEIKGKDPASLEELNQNKDKKKDKKKKWGVPRQTEKIVLGCKAWAKHMNSMTALRMCLRKYPKVPGPCVAGIITALYPKKHIVFLREEGPEQGYPETCMVEYTLGHFISNIRIVPEAELRRSKSVASRPK